MDDVVFHPIGIIHTPFTELEHTPKSWRENQMTRCELCIDPAYWEGLADVRPGERYQIVFYFHRARGSRLTVCVRGTGPLRGVFSTHSPERPNGIGISVITVTDISDGTIGFTGADMLDGTPVLDLKPWFEGM